MHTYGLDVYLKHNPKKRKENQRQKNLNLPIAAKDGEQLTDEKDTAAVLDNVEKGEPLNPKNNPAEGSAKPTPNKTASNEAKPEATTASTTAGGGGGDASAAPIAKPEGSEVGKKSNGAHTPVWRERTKNTKNKDREKKRESQRKTVKGKAPSYLVRFGGAKIFMFGSDWRMKRERGREGERGEREDVLVWKCFMVCVCMDRSKLPL